MNIFQRTYLLVHLDKAAKDYADLVSFLKQSANNQNFAFLSFQQKVALTNFLVLLVHLHKKALH